jgi:hypothetical protein
MYKAFISACCIIYIYWALLYELKNGGFLFMLAEELWIYMDVNIKAYNPCSLISSLS